MKLPSKKSVIQLTTDKNFVLTTSEHTETNEPLETVSPVRVTRDFAAIKGATNANIS